jgi:hypothetical protein
MSPGCQEKNAKGLTMVAVGVNKAAEQYMLLDEQTREELASGKYHDQRRGSFGPVPSGGAKAPAGPVAGRAVAGGAVAGGPVAGGPRRAASRPAGRHPWSKSQEKLALLYNAQGLRPDEIAQKLRLSPYTVTQIILTSRSQGKL